MKQKLKNPFLFSVACNFRLTQEKMDAIHYAAELGCTLKVIAGWSDVCAGTVSRVLRAQRLAKPIARRKPGKSTVRPTGRRGKAKVKDIGKRADLLDIITN